MQVRLKRPWSQWSKGHVFTDMPGGQARTLIDRGIAEKVEVSPQLRAINAPADRMMPAPIIRNQRQRRI